MGIERVSDKGKTKVQDTVKRKDFVRDESERLNLDTSKGFLRAGNSEHAKPLPIGWVERHENDSIEKIDEKITKYEDNVDYCNKHKQSVNMDWYTNSVKKLRWFKEKKKELSGETGTS